MKGPDAIAPSASHHPRSGTPGAEQAVTGYAELQVTSNYSFLRGASHVEELLGAGQAAWPAGDSAITDRNTLAGIARAHQRAEEAGIRLVVGCRLDLRDSLPVLVYPTDRDGYAQLCRLLTLGKGRAGKGACHLDWQDLAGARRWPDRRPSAGCPG